MPRGDGQGGNNGQGEERGPRSADEILSAKIKLHEQAAAGEIESKEPREWHAFAADKVRAELAELVERGAGMLEAMEGHAWLSEALRGQPPQIAVAELGLSQRTLNALDEYGILWASELAQWTEAMARCIENFGASTVVEINKALASVGLKLREPRAGEDGSALLPRASKVSDSRASIRLASSPARADELARQRKMLIALAGGATQHEAEAAAGLRSGQSGPAWNLKARIRARLKKGHSPEMIATDLGFPPASVLGGSVAAYVETQRFDRRGGRKRDRAT